MPLRSKNLQTLEVPAARSETRLGTYSRNGYSLEFLQDHMRTGANYHDSLKQVPKGFRMSSAAEELAIQQACEGDPREAEVFDNLFERNGKEYVWQWTSTALRVPKGARPQDYEKYGGNRFYPREVVEGEKVSGEMLVPQGVGGRRGGIVTEWNEVFGVPSETTSNNIPHKDHDTHFWFDPDMKETAVARGCIWHLDEDRCLDVFALYGRSNSGSLAGLRPVRGSAPEVGVRQVA